METCVFSSRLRHLPIQRWFNLFLRPENLLNIKLKKNLGLINWAEIIYLSGLVFLPPQHFSFLKLRPHQTPDRFDSKGKEYLNRVFIGCNCVYHSDILYMIAQTTMNVSLPQKRGTNWINLLKHPVFRKAIVREKYDDTWAHLSPPFHSINLPHRLLPPVTHPVCPSTKCIWNIKKSWWTVYLSKSRTIIPYLFSKQNIKKRNLFALLLVIHRLSFIYRKPIQLCYNCDDTEMKARIEREREEEQGLPTSQQLKPNDNKDRSCTQTKNLAGIFCLMAKLLSVVYTSTSVTNARVRLWLSLNHSLIQHMLCHFAVKK